MIYQYSTLSFRILTGVVFFSLLTPALPGLSQEEEKKKETITYTATVVGTGAGVGAKSHPITIYINDYTSDEQVQDYLDMVAEKNPGLLRSTLEKVSGLGRIAMTGFIGNELAVVREHDTDQGKLYNLVTARNMGFAELYISGRTTNYPYSFLQLLVDEEGKGQGTLILAARFSFDKDGKLEIESYGRQPFQLWNLQRWLK